MSGFNVLMYYSGTLFALVGFSNPVAVGLVVSI
jgi:SP family myo-inositol transporter-like MFS transporter 13